MLKELFICEEDPPCAILKLYCSIWRFKFSKAPTTPKESENLFIENEKLITARSKTKKTPRINIAIDMLAFFRDEIKLKEKYFLPFIK